MTTPAPQTATATPGEREPVPPGAPPGAPPEGTPFHSALETEWARTATAEGHRQSRSESPSSAISHRTPVHRARSAEAGTSTPSPLSLSRTAGDGAGVASTAVAAPCASDPAATSTPAPLTPSSTAGAGGPGSALAPAALNDPSADVLAGNNPAANTPANDPAANTPANDPAASAGGNEPDASSTRNAGDGSSVFPATTALEGSPADATGASATLRATGLPPAEGAPPIADSTALPASGDAATSGVGHDPSATHGTASPLPAGASATPHAGARTAGGGWVREGALAGGGGWTREGTHAGVGNGWSPPAGAHGTVAPQGLRSAGGANAHDKLWVPDPAQASPGGDAAAGGVGTAGLGGLAAGSDTASTSATPGADAQGPLLDYGVGLQQAIETLHGTIQLAARQGLTQARIALEPEGLGEIRVHLTQTTQGLLARVTAETPVAAQALAAAHAELRQTLSSLGLNLARLDVGRHGHSATQDGSTALGGGGRGGSGGGEASARGARSGRADATAVPPASVPDHEVTTDAQPAPAPSRGALLDVLV